jgi:two-component system nitrogen regulation response regulator GlnG
MERLRAYAWPGNLRELQSVLKQALLRASGTVLLPAFLPDVVGGGTTDPAAAPLPGDVLSLDAFIRQHLAPDACDLYADTHRQLDRLLLPLVLQYTHGSRRQAARLLGIARQTLRLKLRELGLHVAPPAEPEDDDQP